jgi:hypothetical protein
VKIIGVLSYFDERPSWLAGVVAGLYKAQVSHVVAVDGAYGLYPGGRPYSGPEQQASIVEVCRSLEMGCTWYAPQEPYFGNEVEKRNIAFRLAEAVAEPFEDWYFLADADHFVTSALGLTHRLREAPDDHDAGMVRFCEPYGAIPSWGPLRCVFRAIPGLKFEGNHYTYRTPDGRDLHAPDEPALDLSCVEVEHRTAHRDRYRKELQQDYYRRRDEMGVEQPEHELTAA